MKRLALAIGLAAVVAVMGLSTALAATDITAGNDVVTRAELDSRSNFYLVDTNNPFDHNGKIESWRVWAENTKQVQLVIYRHSGNDMAANWTVVGTSDVETPVAGQANTFDLDDAITVKSGDYVGLYFPQDGGSVSFDFASTNAPYEPHDFNGKVLFTATSPSGPAAFVDSSDRIYSVKAFDTATDASNGDDEDDEDKDKKDKDGINGNGRNFGTHLSGDEASTDSQAQGQANFKLSKDGKSLEYKLNVANIEDVVSAGLYRDSEDEPVVELYSTSDDDSVEGRFQGTLAEGDITDDLTDDLEELMADIRDGKIYVAVFTKDSGDDPEILGWLMAKGHGEDELQADEEDNEAASVEDDDSDKQVEKSEKVRGWEKNVNDNNDNKDKKGNKKNS